MEEDVQDAGRDSSPAAERRLRRRLEIRTRSWLRWPRARPVAGGEHLPRPCVAWAFLGQTGDEMTGFGNQGENLVCKESFSERESSEENRDQEISVSFCGIPTALYWAALVHESLTWQSHPLPLFWTLMLCAANRRSVLSRTMLRQTQKRFVFLSSELFSCYTVNFTDRCHLALLMSPCGNGRSVYWCVNMLLLHLYLSLRIITTSVHGAGVRIHRTMRQANVSAGQLNKTSDPSQFLPYLNFSNQRRLFYRNLSSNLHLDIAFPG